MHVIYARKVCVKKLFFPIFLSIFCVGIFMYMHKNNIGVFVDKDKKLPIYSVDTKDKKIAITFDSNWGNDNTMKILDVLDKYNAKATFFLIGRWVEDYPNETKEIYKRGNEIGNHSYKHLDMTTMSKQNIKKDIAMADEKIYSVTGTKTKVFRCPSGSYDSSTIEAAESTGHKCIQWNIDSIDWKEQGQNVEYDRVIKNIKPGSIILFHNNAKYTPKNLDRMLNKLKSDGYKFVRISDLIYDNNYYIDYMGRQVKK
ncbi:polysaccharide deacetylase [Clostridium acetobutylicum]|nr:polysaccharide deacetylase [Clostridium acetobutylicum]